MSDDQRRIHELLTAWHAATTTGDVSKLLPLMAEDVVFLIPGQPPMRGREAFAAAFQAGLEHFRIEYSWKVEEIQVSGNLAWCWCHLTVSMMPLHGGSPKRRAGNTLSILRKTAEGIWLLARDANLLTAEPTNFPR